MQASIHKMSSERLRKYLIKEGRDEDEVMTWDRSRLMEEWAIEVGKGEEEEFKASPASPAETDSICRSAVWSSKSVNMNRRRKKERKREKERNEGERKKERNGRRRKRERNGSRRKKERGRQRRKNKLIEIL